MSLRTTFRMMAINPNLRNRLVQQNTRRVGITTYDVRTKVVGQDRPFLFRLYQGKDPIGHLQGTPYRILASEPNPAEPLFPTPVGIFDYRIVRGLGSGTSAICGMSHGRSSPFGDKMAVKVALEVGQEVRGIGRAMASIALNHIAEEGGRKLLVHNVMAMDFVLGLSRTSRIVEAYDLDHGEIDLSEADAKDENTVINVEIGTTRVRDLPRIKLTLRSEPREILATRPPAT